MINILIIPDCTQSSANEVDSQIQVLSFIELYPIKLIHMEIYR